MQVTDEEMGAMVNELEWWRGHAASVPMVADLQAELRAERDKRLATRQRFIVAATAAAMGWIGFVYLGLRPVIGW
jgi:hypothetical protein